ncbi:MAG TPA: ABC transporter permease [Cyclobacteriaceae bacterium]|nr:ABC transporter permease [Cyclobacteriaceae bacterium]
MRPPKIAIRFLRWFCREDYVEEIEGDLVELFEKEPGRWAPLKFAWRVLKYFRPAFIKSLNGRRINNFYMLNHILLITFRNFLRHKRIFAINLIGLTAGLTSVLLIYMWVQDELSIDQFHVNKDRLFQVKQQSPGPDKTMETFTSSSVLLPGMLETEMPEVEYVIPFRPTPIATVSIGSERVQATGAFAGSDFFKVFSFPIIYGDINTALKDKYNVAISTDLAMRLFGSVTNCIGKPINWDLQRFGGDFVISAVFEKSGKSSESFDFLATHEMFLEKNPMDVSWDSNPIMVNLTLRDGVDVNEFNDKLNKLYKVKRTGSADWEGVRIFVQRYSDVYLYSRFENGKVVGGRIDYVVLFSVVAIFILLIACINFMNLSTARAQSRMKEIGIKKGLGVQRGYLVIQHMGESIALSMIALVLSGIAIIILLPEFSVISGKHLTLNDAWQLFSGAFVITLLTGIIAGSYPAFYLSGFKTVKIMKGQITSSKSELLVRRGLVVFQFGISIVLVIGVVVVYRQLKLVQSWDLGYQKDNVVLIKKQGELNTKLDVFLNQARQIPGVLGASSTGASIIDNTNSSWGHNWEGQQPGGDQLEFSGATINYGLIETLGIEMKYGRAFSDKFNDESTGVIINETAMKQMGITEPIGKWMELFGSKREIIGVTKDFHFQSLYTPLKPQFMMIGPRYTNTIVIRIANGTEVATLDGIKALCKEFNPGIAFEFTFLDDDYKALYFSEQRISALAQYFALVAIILSCLGLFGLAAYSAERRTKEISIRKVLGCSEWRIMRMLSMEFAVMVIASASVALPIAWYFSEKWLGTFAYRSELPISMFIITAIGVLLIALITVGMQAIKTARINPAVTLKSE